jgi:hypothetical protein
VKQALACAGLLVVSLPAVARPPGIRLQIGDCLAPERADVERIVAIELRAPIDDLAPDALDVDVRCGVAASVEIEARDGLGRTSTRAVDLSTAIAAGRARLLALAIAELVTEARRAAPPPPIARPPAVPPPRDQIAEKAKAPRARRGRLQLSAIAAGHGFFSGVGLVAGGGLRLAHDLRYSLGWNLDLFAEHGGAAVAAGTVAADVISADALLAFHREWGRVGLRLAAGVRTGAVRLSGTPGSPAVEGATLWGAHFGPMALASLVIAPVRRLAIEIAVDGGDVVVPVSGRVGGGASVAVDGGWIGFLIALGYFL